MNTLSFKKLVRIIWSCCCLVTLAAFIKHTYPDMRELHPSPFNRDGWASKDPYPADVSKAIALLEKYDPTQAQMIEEYRMPIDVLNTDQMDAIGMSHRRLAETMQDTGTIHINGVACRDSDRIAFALHHELTHIEYGTQPSRASTMTQLKRILWRNEESDAHMRTFGFAWRYRHVKPDVASWVASGGEEGILRPLGIAGELATYAWPLGTILTLATAVIVPWLPLKGIRRNRCSSASRPR